MAIFHLSFCIPIHFERKQPGLIRGRDRNGCQTNNIYESFIDFNRFTKGVAAFENQNPLHSTIQKP
jgi:hypothetical protein